MQTLQSFIAEHKITMDCEWSDSNPNIDMDAWSKTAAHWKCTLKIHKRRMTVYFSQGSAHIGEPKLAAVLDCVASDAAELINSGTFEDWCSKYGYDTDSRKAERTYQTIKSQASKLRSFLNDTAAYETLLFNMERQ
jgi:hypothetical protein